MWSHVPYPEKEFFAPGVPFVNSDRLFRPGTSPGTETSHCPLTPRVVHHEKEVPSMRQLTLCATLRQLSGQRGHARPVAGYAFCRSPGPRRAESGAHGPPTPGPEPGTESVANRSCARHVRHESRGHEPRHESGPGLFRSRFSVGHDSSPRRRREYGRSVVAIAPWFRRSSGCPLGSGNPQGPDRGDHGHGRPCCAPRAVWTRPLTRICSGRWMK